MFSISLSINPIITHLHPDPPRMDRRPRGKNDRARRGRGGNFAKLSSSSLRRRAPHAARRPSGSAGESGAAAGEVQRIYALRHRRRRGGKEGGETDGWRRCAAPFALLSASSSLALLLRRRCAKTCRGVRAGGRATVRTDADARCVCLAGAADDRVRVLHFVRRQTGHGPDPYARPPGRPTQACKILDRRGGRRRLRPRLLACRSVFAELARCCSLSSLQRVRRKSLFLPHPFLALLTRCDAIHYLSESYY